MTGNELKALRKAYKLTQGELAAKIKTARVSITRYEKLGNKSIPEKIVLLLQTLTSEKIG